MYADLFYVLRNLPNHDTYYVQEQIISHRSLRIKQFLKEDDAFANDVCRIN